MAFVLRTAAGFLAMLVCLGNGLSPSMAGERRAEPPDPSALAAVIDREIGRRLDESGIAASPLSEDAQFLRRVHLDLTGTIPTYARTVAFLESDDPDKRGKLIDELLDDSRYAQHMADTWLPRLFIDTSRRHPEKMQAWLEEQFGRNRPWDELVRDIISATGKEPPVQFFLENQTLSDATEATARAFLGIQLQCAQCHDHPMTSWTQDDYWGLAAFYSKVSKYTLKRTVTIEELSRRELQTPPDGHRPMAPRFLEGESAGLDPDQPYRPALARWTTSAENAYFARAMVNRMWAHFLGRGFVHPADDLGDHNPPSHPELLDTLAQQFAAGGFDVKLLIASICRSQAYQRASAPSGNERDRELFGRMAVRSLTPRQLARSRAQLLGDRAGGSGFLRHFATNEEPNPSEIHHGISQTLMQMNSLEGNSVGNLARTIVQPGEDAEQTIDRLFLHVYCRRPTAEERARLADYLAGQRDRVKACGDVLWALLNSAEFHVIY